MVRKVMTVMAIGVAAALLLAACGSGETTTVTVTETALAGTDAVGLPTEQESSTDEPGVVDDSEPRFSFSAGDDADPRVFFDEAAPSAPATTVVTFRTEQILEFQQLSGDPAFVQNGMDRIQNGVWAFASDGSAGYDTTNVAHPPYPLYGGFQGDGQHATFRVSGTSQQGYSGFITVEMDGSIDTSVSPPTLHFTYSASNSLASSVGGIGQGGGNTTVYEGRVSLRQG